MKKGIEKWGGNMIVKILRKNCIRITKLSSYNNYYQLPFFIVWI